MTRFQELSEGQWSELWLRQAEHNDVAELPRVASAEVQQRLHGVSGRNPVAGALQFRRLVKEFIRPLGPNARFLDLGCGWGRHIRVFLKDFAAQNMYGADIDPANIALCEEALPDVNMLLCREGEALDIAPGSVDLVISFSVFSHLNEASARFWLNELARIVKADGAVVVTSWGRTLFDIIQRLRTTGKLEVPWEANIARAFADLDDIAPRYAAGEYVFGRHGNSGSLDPDLYGISLMPGAWVEKNTPLRVRRLIDDPKLLPQTAFFLTR